MAKMIETTENIQIPGGQIVSDSGITWLGTKSGDNVQSDRDNTIPYRTIYYNRRKSRDLKAISDLSKEHNDYNNWLWAFGQRELTALYPQYYNRSAYIRQVHEQPPIVKDTSCPNRNDTVEYMNKVMDKLEKNRIPEDELDKYRVIVDILENIHAGQLEEKRLRGEPEISEADIRFWKNHIKDIEDDRKNKEDGQI